MKVLVTGVNGQLGRALAATAPAGTALVALDRAALDIGDEKAVRARVDAERPDLILNAAAYTAVDRAESEQDAAARINTKGPGNLATAAAGLGARLAHVSTDFVFDGASSRPYLPTDTPSPLGVYGATKRGGEEAVLAALPDALIVRTAWVYSATGHNFVHTMLRLMRERGQVSVVADQIGTPTHAPSLARAIWALADAEAAGIHHFTDAGVASWYDFAVAIAEEAADIGLIERANVLPIRTEDYPTPARRPAYGVLDKSATWAITGTAGHWRTELRLMLAELKRA